MKKTPWFGPTVKPARVGVYETFFDGGEQDGGASYWNGKRWSNQFTHWRDFNENRPYYGGAIQKKRWRGLTTKDGK